LNQLKSSFDKDFTTIQQMYYNYFAQKSLDPSFLNEAKKKKIATNLQSLLKKDDSLQSLGYGFNIANELGESASFIFEKIEDAIAQADEIDGKMLQFEGGLSVTSLIVDGILKLSTLKPSLNPIDVNQATKFTRYFLSRRSVTTAKGASAVIESLKLIMEQKNISPISIRLADNGKINPEKPILKVQITNLLGEPLTEKPASVKISILTSKKQKSSVSDESMTPSSADSTIYTLDLTNKNLAKGQYLVEINAGKFQQTDLTAIVLGKVKLNNIDVSVSDAESQSPSKQYTLAGTDKLPGSIVLDHQQKIVFRFDLLDSKTNNVIDVHQCFVKFSDESGAEIIFIAEQDVAKAYKFEMDVGARANDFGGRSGVYTIDLIVGDKFLANSLVRRVGEISLKFTYDTRKSQDDKGRFKAKTEIHHLFREPEKRPPRFVSDLFTILCLTPILILFSLWLKIGLRLSNFTFSLSSLGFHSGLAGIFGLFICFWLKLNMFQTIKYLIPLATFTFLSGNKVLRYIANKRLEKSN
jgi:oligosaccharyltransferase complex subunit delta (ribophorin II)